MIMIKISSAALCCIYLLMYPCFVNAAPITSRIELSNFGAVPNDGEDDSASLVAAMKYCRENPGTTLLIAPGIYNYTNELAKEIEYNAVSGAYGEDVQGQLFKPDAPYVTALDLRGSRDITIVADGATILLEGWYEVITLERAENIHLKGLTIDYKRPPNTVGTIIDVQPSYFDMEFDPEYYSFLTNQVTGRVHFHDVQQQRLYLTGGITGKTLLTNSTVRIFTERPPNLGDACILRHSGHYRPAIMIKNAAEILVEDVRIHAQPGMGIVGHMSENITLRNLQVIPKAGGVISTNTDATHFTSCTGTLIIEHSKFGGQGDDCTNIHNYYYTLMQDVNHPEWIELKIANADLHALSLDYPSLGDTLALVFRENLIPHKEFVVKEVAVSEERWQVRVKLDMAVPGPIENFYMTNQTKRPAVKIRNNTVRSHLARAFLIKSSAVEITGNVMQSSTGTAIQLGAEASWRESGPVSNVLVANNWIVDCGYGHGNQHSTAAISVDVSGITGSRPLLNTDIVIRNNVIQSTRSSNQAIFISGANAVMIVDNDISGSQYAIKAEHTTGLTFGNNGSLPNQLANSVTLDTNF